MIAGVLGAIALTVLVPFSAGADSVIDTIAVDATTASSSAATLSPDGSRLYVSDAAVGTVSVVDTATRAVVDTIAVTNAGGLAVSPDGTRLYVVSSVTNTLVVVDTATDAIVTTIPVAAAPFAVALSPDGARAYLTSVNGSVTSPLTVIDTATDTVITTIGVPVGPRSIIVSPDGSRLYIAGSTPTTHDITVIDTATRTIAGTIPVGPFTNAVTGFAISADGGTLYAAGTNSDSVRVIDTATNTITSTIPAGDGAYGISLTPDGTRAYVTNAVAGAISVIDLATNAVVSTISIGTTPRSIDISADGAFAYVANSGSDTVSVLAIDTFPGITTTSLADGTIGAAYTSTVAVTGSPMPTLSVTSGSLPPGLTLSGDTIAGTPAAAGTYTFTVTGSSSVSGIPSTVDRVYTVVVSALPADAPLPLTATRDASSAVLGWTTPSFDGGSAITGYRIERSTDGAPFTTLVANTASLAVTYTDATTAAGHTYRYRVSALNGVGLGAVSNVAAVTIPAASTPTPPPTPADSGDGSDPAVGGSPAAGALPATGDGVDVGPLLAGIGLFVAGAGAILLGRRARRRRA